MLPIDLCNKCKWDLEKDYFIRLKCNHDFHFKCVIHSVKDYNGFLTCPICEKKSLYVVIDNEYLNRKRIRIKQEIKEDIHFIFDTLEI